MTERTMAHLAMHARRAKPNNAVVVGSQDFKIREATELVLHAVALNFYVAIRSLKFNGFFKFEF